MIEVQFIDRMDIAGKRVLVRVDFNVPLENGRVADDARIRAALPTIRLALGKGSRVIVVSHLDRPGGKVVPELSLAPVARRLSELLEAPVTFVDEVTGPRTAGTVAGMLPGSVVMLENLRFDPGEEKNDEALARRLASYAEVYIDDAFADAHRWHASTVGVAGLVAERGGGLLMKRELDTLTAALDSPRRPLVVVMGGAKVATKMGVVEHLLGRADALLVGGAMAFPFLRAQGHAAGTFQLPPEAVEQARRILATAENAGRNLALPSDLAVADPRKEGAAEVLPVEEVGPDREALDIGPGTIARFVPTIEGAGTVIWNGPMGTFEREPFGAGTRAVAEAAARSSAFSLVGGGDTGRALERYGLTRRMSYVSTGGGSFLEVLAGKILPAVKALEEKVPVRSTA